MNGLAELESREIKIAVTARHRRPERIILAPFAHIQVSPSWLAISMAHVRAGGVSSTAPPVRLVVVS
jgi:hypothetical protein